MQTQPAFDRAPHAHGTARDCPEPLSLETIAVIQQVLGDVLHALRERVTGHAARDAGAIEYASWRQHLH
jgi:hypothetical protein